MIRRILLSFALISAIAAAAHAQAPKGNLTTVTLGGATSVEIIATLS